MSRLLREYTPLAVAATGLIALVVVVGLILRPADDEGLPRGSSDRTPATVPAAGPAAEPNDGTAVMALHDAPRALPELRFKDGSGEPDFAVVAFSIDRAGIGVVDAFYTEIGVKNLARYIDESGGVAQQLNALGPPTTLLLDRDGRKIARHVGPAEWDTPAMVAFFRQHLSQQSGALRPGGVIKWAGEQSIHAAPALALPPVLRLAINEGISS